MKRICTVSNHFVLQSTLYCVVFDVHLSLQGCLSKAVKNDDLSIRDVDYCPNDRYNVSPIGRMSIYHYHAVDQTPDAEWSLLEIHKYSPSVSQLDNLFASHDLW